MNDMKKIMFNDKYGLAQAVLEGRKTQTRRIVPDGTPLGNWCETEAHSRYKVGEEVAVAQCYDDIYMEKNAPCPIPDEYRLNAYNKGFNQGHKGWKNKMFVLPDDMPFRIKITKIRVERLQDISNEDCLAEGIYAVILDNENGRGIQAYTFGEFDEHRCYNTPRVAYANLIDKVSGKGTWESNPWVYVYDFELVR